jgi:HPt (histidine-containing phosphotransfer) domain-containing protein
MTTILVASGDSKFRGRIQSLLTGAGSRFATASIIEAGSAREAFAALAGHTLQLAIFDDTLPDRAPSWAADLQNAAKRTPVLVLAGLADGALSAGTNITVLRNPAELDRLRGEIERILPAPAGPAPDMQAQLDEAMRALKLDYIASLAPRLQSIREAVGRARSASDREAAENARNLIHQIRGTGASFGLPELSDAAARGETALIKFKNDPGANVWADVDRAVADMEAAAAKT